jgi:hypothetical protein
VDATKRNQFLNRWLSDLDGSYAEERSDLDDDYAKRLQQLERKYQRYRERIHDIWSEDAAEDVIEDTAEDVDSQESSSPVAQGLPARLQESTPTTNGESISTSNGLPEGLTRRQIVWRIIPDFHGETFKVADVRERYLDKYLETEPPHFTQALSNLLRRMADKGEIGRKREGDGRKSPWVYFVKESDEETLLKSGP